MRARKLEAGIKKKNADRSEAASAFYSLNATGLP